MSYEKPATRRPSAAFTFLNVATALAIVVFALLTTGCRAEVAESSPAMKQPAPAVRQADLVKRGEYLVTVGGCNDCHTPFKMGPNGPEKDASRMLSGHPEFAKLPPAPVVSGPWMWTGAAPGTAFAGPWGLTYSANLTPDVNTGIGSWNEEIFIKTLRTGKHWGVARPIQPPMPWENYGKMTDQDLRAVFAYLRSIPPVHNRVPEPLMAPPPAPAAGSR